MRRVVRLLLAGVMIPSMAGVASADSYHHPHPPKCEHTWLLLSI